MFAYRQLGKVSSIWVVLKKRTQKTAQGAVLLGTGFGCFYGRYSIHTCETHTTSDGHSHGTFSVFQFCLVWLKSGHMFCRRAQAILLHLLALGVLQFLTLAEQRYGRFQAGLVAVGLA